MTQEEIEGNKLIGVFLGSKWINDAPEEYPEGYYYVPESFDEDCPTGLPKDWGFSESMDWLYPVYQKIVKVCLSGTFDRLDVYSRSLLVGQEDWISKNLVTAKDISIIFKEIVEWIKIYNLKVLEDGKT